MTTLPIILKGFFFLTIIGFYLLFKFWYKKAIVESHRMNLFELRSRLYALVQNYQIDPDEPAYRHTEMHINQLLRYSHNTTTLRMMFSMFVIKMGWYTPTNSRHYVDGIKSIPEVEHLDNEIVQTLVQIKRESMKSVTTFLPRYSPAWYIVRYLLLFYMRMKGAFEVWQKPIEALVISRDYDLNDYNEHRNNKIKKVVT